MQPSSYGWLMLAGIAVSAFFWTRLARRDDRLLIVYISALVAGVTCSSSRKPATITRRSKVA